MALNSVSEDIRTLLNTGGKGTAGTDLFAFQWGSNSDGVEVDEQTLVEDTEFLKVINKEDYENPTFIIFVRGKNDGNAKYVHDKARDIYQFMLAQLRQTINGIEYIQFEPIDGPRKIGKDDKNRFVYTMNFYTFRDSTGDSI